MSIKYNVHVIQNRPNNALITEQQFCLNLEKTGGAKSMLSYYVPKVSIYNMALGTPLIDFGI